MWARLFLVGLATTSPIRAKGIWTDVDRLLVGMTTGDAPVGHSVRSSVLCGPVSCREVDDVATTNESVARLECGGADGVDAGEPVAAYAGGSGRAGGGVAGGCRRAELHSRRAEGRTPR